MIATHEIRARLHAAVERAGLSQEREKVARFTAALLVSEVEKILKEEIRAVKSKERKEGI